MVLLSNLVAFRAVLCDTSLTTARNQAEESLTGPVECPISPLVKEAFSIKHEVEEKVQLVSLWFLTYVQPFDVCFDELLHLIFIKRQSIVKS